MYWYSKFVALLIGYRPNKPNTANPANPDPADSSDPPISFSYLNFNKTRAKKLNYTLYINTVYCIQEKNKMYKNVVQFHVIYLKITHCYFNP